MKGIKKYYFTTILFCGIVSPSVAEEDNRLVGSWCFYEQTSAGQVTSEKIEITLNEDKTYKWQEAPIFKQEGTWSIESDSLVLSNIGTHNIISINENEMQLKNYSVMKLHKGTCAENTFSSQEIIHFHNSASRGKLKVLETYISRDIDINAIDVNRGDTALIKATKSCKTEAAKLLINAGANKQLANYSGKTALDYSKSSSFHDGCDELVLLLK